MCVRQTPDSQPLQTFEWTTANGPSSALLRAVSAVADEDPRNMKPLYEVVDPDSLDKIFTPSQHHRGPPSGRVQFEYLDYTVVIKANGRGYIYDQEAN